MAFIIGKLAINWLHGTAFNDLMIGSKGFDFIDGKEGSDLMLGFGGSDELIGGYGNDAMAGGLGNDTLDGGSGIDLMIGGFGNDVYYYDNPKDKIVEFMFGGNDEVRAWIDATLPNEVEKLTLLETAVSGTGNGAANVITGNGMDNVLNGLGGNDTLTGGAGADRFVVGSGKDVITDFDIAEGDSLDIAGSYKVRQVGGDAVISFSGGSVTLLGVDADEVTDAFFA